MHSQLLRQQAMKPRARRNPESEGCLFYGDLTHHRLEIIHNREGQRWPSTPASPWAVWLLVTAPDLVPSLHLSLRGVVWRYRDHLRMNSTPRNPSHLSVMSAPIIGRVGTRTRWWQMNSSKKWRGWFLKGLMTQGDCVFETEEGEESSDSDMNSKRREQRQTDWITESEQEDKSSHK